MKINAFNREIYDLKCGTLQSISNIDIDLLASTLSCIDPWKTLEYTHEKIEHYLAQESDASLHRYTLKLDQQLCGVICVRTHWLKGVYLEFLGIVPSYQRVGFGTHIMNWLEIQARLGGFSNLWVLVSGFNKNALAFYKKLGFNQIGIIDDFIKFGHVEIILRKVVV